MSSQTPLMSQYLGVKKEHPDAILLFRLGDFYEMFYDDAKTASEILGIALTSGDRSKKNPVPLCSVPCHSAEPHISKLLASGKRWLYASREKTGGRQLCPGPLPESAVFPKRRASSSLRDSKAA